MQTNLVCERTRVKQCSSWLTLDLGVEDEKYRGHHVLSFVVAALHSSVPGVSGWGSTESNMTMSRYEESSLRDESRKVQSGDRRREAIAVQRVHVNEQDFEGAIETKPERE